MANVATTPTTYANGGCAPSFDSVLSTSYSHTSTCSNCGMTCGTSNSSLCPRCGCAMTSN